MSSYIFLKQIQESDVDNFTPGEEIPECVLVSHWSKTDQPPVDLAHKVPLLGARGQEYFMLNMNHGMQMQINYAN